MAKNKYFNKKINLYNQFSEIEYKFYISNFSKELNNEKTKQKLEEINTKNTNKDFFMYFKSGILNSIVQNYNEAISDFTKAIFLDPKFSFS